MRRLFYFPAIMIYVLLLSINLLTDFFVLQTKNFKVLIKNIIAPKIFESPRFNDPFIKPS